MHNTLAIIIQLCCYSNIESNWEVLRILVVLLSYVLRSKYYDVLYCFPCRVLPPSTSLLHSRTIRHQLHTVLRVL
jgi:hypothetical protein